MKTIRIMFFLTSGLWPMVSSSCGIPVAIAVQGDGASVGYSSKGGLVVTVQK